MTHPAVILAVIDHVHRDADGYLCVPVGTSEGDAFPLRFSSAAARMLVEELERGLKRPSGISSADPLQHLRIPAVTDRMKKAGAEVLTGAAKMSAEELATLVYRAMALELAVVGPGDPL